ncbi:cobalt-precorrin-8 methylmutase [Streptococcus suis]|uniref:Cobalt-precorrin-8 methylmutase n=1 Tax=Streptococcus suis TaxID=1307 RepID=A0A9X4RRJ0_STRSU|nr:cobalt-precorrin-8 methylmutase [Streptococcus suis]MBY5024852.1 cobalt-precorrin-8 methylmutase [Streptococcus suis]MCK3935758.1 cobalt-precorrin-8 methylmutase [Streptococcus suis]MDG4526242.1 cobalt-precorrin-8 methylmutase [Streptococcus suis]MDG4528805.1 cobalt-precorrin-8 methylmutase [Streptococcus suis]QZT18369.1 cobalt-precorrin-8 methylmutase [Streptococcus suis]
MAYMTNAHEIEAASYQKIQEIITEQHPELVFTDSYQEAVLKRVVFTSADFDYLYNIQFSNHAIEEIVKVLKNKGTIFTDTTMVLGGFNKKLLDRLGVSYRCLVNEPEIFKEAKEKGITRSMAAVEHAAKVKGPKLFVFGNAPTSIFKVLEMVEAGKLEPTPVIGVPVGFVGAAESKLQLHESSLPAISALGRKGGSTIAAAIVNAILYQLKSEDKDGKLFSPSEKTNCQGKCHG